MTVGFKTFFSKRDVDTVFIVKNVTESTPLGPKAVKIFNFPVQPGHERDLLDIPEVSEADIRHSLLKGVLKIKFKENELLVVRSNIDLLQFDDEQKAFLESIGITEGLEVVAAAADIPFIFRQEQALVGVTDSSNRTFTMPGGDKFIDGALGANIFHVLIRHNGRDLVQGIDFTISESGGLGTGFDTVYFVSFKPNTRSELVANYVIEA